MRIVLYDSQSRVVNAFTLGEHRPGLVVIPQGVCTASSTSATALPRSSTWSATPTTTKSPITGGCRPTPTRSPVTTSAVPCERTCQTGTRTSKPTHGRQQLANGVRPGTGVGGDCHL
jgi:hypothetical protein